MGLIGATLGVLLGATPGMAADNGAVDAVVTVEAAAACIELSTSSISFGTLALGAENAAGTPGITVTNCGDADASILASGTNASGTDAAWALVDSAATCADTLGTDNYHLGLATPRAMPGSSRSRDSTAAAAPDGGPPRHPDFGQAAFDSNAAIAPGSSARDPIWSLR